MRFASLGSGSEGNALIVQVDSTCVMVDCGFGIAETGERLARLGLAPDDLTAVLVTHEHGDHLGGVAKFANKYRLPVWLTHGSLAFAQDELDPHLVREVDSHARFSIGAIEVRPYPVPHDAREPVQFVFNNGRGRLGLLTDAGHVTPHIQAQLSGCAALVLECNHDVDMLSRGPYPVPLKERIAGNYGHLDNCAAAQLLASIDCRALKHVVAAHLSQQNNTRDMAADALAGALGCTREFIHIADQETGFGWLDL